MGRFTFERLGLSVIGALALFAIVIALTTIWLFLTNPVMVATSLSEGEVSPLVRGLAGLILQALQSLLKYL